MYEGKIDIKEGDLAGLNLSKDDVEYLLRNGLPLVDEVNPAVGVVFNKPFLAGKFGEKYCVFGREIWDVDLYLCIDATSRKIFANAVEGKGANVYINANIAEFFTFYDHVLPLWVRCDSFDKYENVRSDKRSRAEVQESIARLKKYYFENPDANSGDDDELDLDIRSVKKELKKINKRAVMGDSWWGRILEDMEG